MKLWQLVTFTVLDALYLVATAVLSDSMVKFAGMSAALACAFVVVMVLFVVRGSHYYSLVRRPHSGASTYSLVAATLYSAIAVLVHEALACGCCPDERAFFLVVWLSATVANVANGVIVRRHQRQRRSGDPSSNAIQMVISGPSTPLPPPLPSVSSPTVTPASDDESEEESLILPADKSSPRPKRGPIKNKSRV